MASPVSPGDIQIFLRMKDEFSSQVTSAMQKGAAAIASYVTVGATLKLVTDALKAQAEQEAAINKLNLALANQGRFSAATSKSLVDYAASLQEVSTYADEVILDGEALLASFGMNEEQIKSTTKVALDFAAATGTDLNAAMQLLGKAYAGNTAALGRYGIVVDEGLSKSQKFDAVVTQLGDRFSGSALAATQTYTGQVAVLGNQYGEVQESLGKFLGELMGGSAPFATAIGWCKALAEWFGKDLVIAVSEIRARMLEFFATIAEGGKYLKPLVAGLDAVGLKSETLRNLVNGGEELAAALREDAAAVRKAGDESAAAAGKTQTYANGQVRLKTDTDAAKESLQFFNALIKQTQDEQDKATESTKRLAEEVEKMRVFWLGFYLDNSKAHDDWFANQERIANEWGQNVIQKYLDGLEAIEKSNKKVWASIATEGVFEMEALADSLHEVIGLLDLLGVSADSSLRELVTGLDQAAEGAIALMEGLASGNPASIIAGITGIANAVKGLLQSESGLNRFIGGAMVLGPIGGLAGLIFGGGGPTAGERMAHDIMVMRTEFINASGGLDVLRANAAAAGVSLEGLWNARTVEEYQRAVDNVSAAIARHESAIDKTKAAMERWGLTAADMGPQFAQGMLHEELASIYQDLKLLEAGGADVAALLAGPMGDSIQTFVQQAQASGAALPEFMRPYIQALIDSKDLVDANGNAITDISQLPFTESLEAGVARLIDAVHDLVDSLNGIHPIEVGVAYRINGSIPPGVYGGPPAEAFGVGGGGGKKQPKVIGAAEGFYSPALPADAFFQLHKGERVEVTPASETPARNAQDAGGAQVNVYVAIDPTTGGHRQITENEFRQIAGAVAAGKIPIPSRVVGR